MKTVQVVYFFRKPASLRKENMYVLSFFAKKLPNRLIFYRAYNRDEENEYSPSEFLSYYPKDQKTSDVETETGITESQEAIDNFINEQKSTNTNQKKTATNINQTFSQDLKSGSPNFL